MSKLGTLEVPLGETLAVVPTDPKEFEAFIFAVREQGTREAAQFADRPFVVKWWFAESIELVDDETGEKKRLPRLVLVDANFDTLSFASTGAAQSWDTIRMVRGDGPWPDGLPIIVRLQPLKGNRTTWRLRTYNPA